MKEAVIAYAEKELERLPSDEELEKDESLTFSEGFEKRIEGIKKGACKKQKNTVLRIAGVCAAAVVLVVSVVWMSLPKAGAKLDSIDGLYLERYEDHVDIGFNQFDGYTPLERIEEYYLPTYLPEGAEMVECKDTTTQFKIEWESSKGGKIVFSQYISGDIFQISAEKAAIEYEKINENETVVLYSGDYVNILLSDGKYVYSVSGDIDKKDLVKIMSSLKETDMDKLSK